ncbi:MAG TPA: CPBP family intramembrane glutamic endopeptidase, partial [Longimicrobiales bacterium]|nr:CPBP family intramembrane glutamic endopeptidase [Longimicrobiales bacterium]
RNLAIFVAGVLSVGWIGRGLDVLTGSPATEGPGILLWLVAPFTLSLALRAFAGDGWEDLGLRPNVRGNLSWYAVSILVFPALTAVVVAIGAGLGLTTLPDPSLASLGLVGQAFALGVAPQLLKNVFEEGAWRGYLAPKVYSLGLDGFLGHGIVGLVWGAWHIPYYLFFLDRGVLRDFTTLDLAAFVPLAIAVMIAWAMVYGEIRLATRSFWPAVLMHMVEDAFLNQLFTENHIRIVPGTDWLVSPVNGLVGIVLFTAAAFALRRWRLARKPSS